MVVIVVILSVASWYVHYSTLPCAGRAPGRRRVKREIRLYRNQITGDHIAHRIFGHGCRPTTHDPTELVSWVVGRHVEKGALSPRDWLLIQYQLAANLVAQWDSVPSQPLESWISGILALAQERDACQRGRRDRQCIHLIFGQQRLKSGQQRMSGNSRTILLVSRCIPAA